MPLETNAFEPFHLFTVKIGGQRFKVPHVMDDREFEEIAALVGGSLPFDFSACHFTDVDQLLLNPVIEALPVLDVPVRELFETPPAQAMKLKDRRREESYRIVRKRGDFVLCETELGRRFYQVDGEHCRIVTDLHVQPISLKDARGYIKKHHRHCGPPKFHKFSVCLTVDGEPEPAGVAVASTPKARGQMDGTTLEINRVCSDPRYTDACSKLYALAVRAGKNLGYTRFLSYTLPEESGASLKAAGFRFDGMTQESKRGWDSPSRPRSNEKYPPGAKLRWVLEIK